MKRIVYKHPGSADLSGNNWLVVDSKTGEVLVSDVAYRVAWRHIRNYHKDMRTRCMKQINIKIYG